MSTLDTITPSPVSPLRMTEQEFVDWAGEEISAEWVDGEVRLKVAIDDLHEFLQTAIKASLLALVRRKSLGQVRGDRASMRLPHRPSRREPDVMFIANDNPATVTRTLVDGACDLAVEIVSPDSIDEDYSVKFAEYQTAGIREYWIVDPMRKAVAAYRLDAGKYVPIAADDEKRLRSTVVDGWWLNAEQLFADPMPDAIDLARSLGVV